MQCGLKGQSALGAFSSVCLTNWPSTFGCFCLARMKLASTRPLRWIDVAWLLPDIFTEKEGTGASNTTASVLRAKFFFYMRCENSCHNWCFNFAPGARRRNPWCLSCPAAAQLMINKFMITLNFSVSSFFLGNLKHNRRIPYNHNFFFKKFYIFGPGNPNSHINTKPQSVS